MKRAMVISAALIGFSACAGNLINSFPLQKTAKAPANAANTDVSVFGFDSELYAGVPDLRKDMRIFTEDGREVPFAVQPLFRTKTQMVHNLVPAIVKSLRKINNNPMMILMPSEGAAGSVNGIQLDIQTRNFEKGLTVEGTNDGKKWHKLVDNRVIGDYSDYLPYRVDRVGFTPSKFRIYRLVFADLSEEKNSPLFAMIKESVKSGDRKEILKAIREPANFKIDKVNFIVSKSSAVQVAITSGYPLQVDNAAVKERDSEILVSSNREPITGIKIVTASTNFVRQVKIEVPGEQPEQWRQVAVGRIFSCDYPTFQRRVNMLDMPETRAALYRITILNGTGNPLENLRVEAVGPIYRAIMTGRQPETLNVAYGAQAPMPQYDTAEVLAKLEKPFETVYALGPQSPNPEFNKTFFSSSTFKIALAALMIALVAVGGVVLFKLTRKDEGSGDGE